MIGVGGGDPIVVDGGGFEGKRVRDGEKRIWGLWVWKKRDGGGVVTGDGDAHGGFGERRSGDRRWL